MEDDFALALNLFAGAALNAELWPVALEAIVQATKSRGAILFPVRGQMPRLLLTESVAESTDAYIREGWIHRDERYRVVPHIERRGVGTDLDFISPERMARDPYYQDFLAKHGLRWFAGVKMQAADDLWVLSLQRTTEQEAFSQNEQKKLVALSMQLGGIATLAQALRFARAEGALAAFEATDTPVALLNRSGEVVRANPPMEKLLGPYLKIQNRRLVSFDRQATAALDRALRGLLWASGATATTAPIFLPRPGKRPVVAYPIRIPAITYDAFSPCQACVVLVDLEKRVQPSQPFLASCFNLTGAEIRIVVQLAFGDDLSTVCKRLGIARATGRAHLRSIFSKTGTHRQSELIALLKAFPTLSA